MLKKSYKKFLSLDYFSKKLQSDAFFEIFFHGVFMEIKSIDLSPIEITSAQVSLILKATNEIKSKFGGKEIRALSGKELEYAKSILRGVNDKLQKTGIKVVDIKKRGVEKGAKVKLHDGKEYMLKGLNEYFREQKAQSPTYSCLYNQHEEKIIGQANRSYLREYVSLKLSNFDT